MRLSAPPTIRYVNDATGVANFSAPLVYAGMTALSASYLVLMIRWKGGRPETQQRAARLVLGVYALVIAGIWVLLGLAEVPVEQTRTWTRTTPTRPACGKCSCCTWSRTRPPPSLSPS